MNSSKNLLNKCNRMPWFYFFAPYWTSEIYSKGKYLRKFGYFPFFLPICATSSHGIGEFSSPLNSELSSDAPTHFLFSSEALNKWTALSNKPAYKILAPEIFHRRNKKVSVSDDAQGTIFFPVHSTPEIDDRLNHDETIQFLKNIPKKYHPIHICLHCHDIKKGLHKSYLSAGFKVFTAGNFLDYKFIENFYSLLKKYKFAMSNGVGSYLFYAVEMGIPFSVVGPQPILFNKSDPNFETGRVKSDDHLPEFNKFINLFSGFHSKITAEQAGAVSEKIGENNSISRLHLSFILYKSFFIWIFSPRKIWRWMKQSYSILRDQFQR